MPAYTFSFPAAAAGLPVSILQNNDDEVATDTLGTASEVQGAVILTATLPTGNYSARAADPAIFADFHAPGVLDVPNSLGAGGTIGDPLLFFAGEGGSLAPNGSTSLTFDEVPEGLVPGGSFNLEAGYYSAYVEIDFDEPAEARYLRLKIGGTHADTPCANGPFLISSGATTPTGRTLYVSTAVLLTDGGSFEVIVNHTVDSDVVTPADLDYSFAWVSLTKIA